MTTAISVKDLTVAYKEKPVLWDIDMEVPCGVLMAIVGPNGAGKTTLIKAILGLLTPAAGKVEIFGKPLPQAAKGCRLRRCGGWACCGGRCNRRAHVAAAADLLHHSARRPSFCTNIAGTPAPRP